MRLINTITFQLREFFDTQRPQYAILSHTWGDEEVSYLDFLFLTSSLPATSAGAVQVFLKNPRVDSKGLQKVRESCELARSRGIEWIWVDSCCIDKSSSAELSEAINSMWRWYSDAAECYVYLFDVSTSPERNPEDDSLRLDGAALEDFSRARWFGRGWTLQELLAPAKVLFCNNRWEIFASKAEIGNEISMITRIPLIFLNGTHSPTDAKICSVAMKMSWVSRRHTTRTEDMAYCMFGLFDVNMPLIYGEGRKAFMRLQLEILKKSDDDSIYAWTAPLERSGLLATWPTAFENCSNIVQIFYPDDPNPWLPVQMTSIGLEMRARYPRDDPHQDAVDREHGVQTISTAIPSEDVTYLMMYCGPCQDIENPVTQIRKRGDRGLMVELILQRFGAIWQRVQCDELQLADQAIEDSDKLEAYVIYYVEQQGL